MPIDDPSQAPPGWLERSACVLIGVIAGGAGGYVAFERSNQLGSAVLLAIGALFLVIGIQGTRLMRFTSGSNVVELEQKKQFIADAIVKAAEEGNPEKASGIAEGAAIANPALAPHVRVGLQYELQVSAAVVGLGYMVSRREFDTGGIDLSISDGSGNLINAIVKRSLRRLTQESVRPAAERALRSVIPVVLISYSGLSESTQRYADAAENFDAVQWRDEDDNEALGETLRRIFPQRASGGTESSP